MPTLLLLLSLLLRAPVSLPEALVFTSGGNEPTLSALNPEHPPLDEGSEIDPTGNP